MEEFYRDHIKNEEITMDDVPKRWKAVTEKWLDSN
ncbi:hypothetical protein EDD76_11980 [Kineothrix alysoides]|uniref:Uncharacterized protein n=1 Tax=Kineothrix alysoides TaxID=1469948 RepID=A0A4R1QUP2_9FIRM|nr:hypothetical protein EDD76_11980 [Kineothrix alysoides]